MTPLIIAGAGAAGIFAAIQAAEAGVGPIVVLEKSSQILQKVKISGGGRCNVTHQPLPPRELASRYPRGNRSLIGPFTRFASQQTIHWFQQRGIQLKTEADGRMFPTTDQSQTIIDTLLDAAKSQRISIQTKTELQAAKALPHPQADQARFQLQLKNQQQPLRARSLLLATGGSRTPSGANIAQSLGHHPIPPVPSLFTFKIDHPLLQDLAGVSVEHTQLRIPLNSLSHRSGAKDQASRHSSGPLLVTHWGISGPATLKLSAQSARLLAQNNYQFHVHINWLPDQDPQTIIQNQRQQHGKRSLHSRSPFPQLPKRLWSALLQHAQIPATTTYAQLNKHQLQQLNQALTQSSLPVSGKSLNKDEFVTCGGIPLKEISLKTMQSKHSPGLYFAGELLDIDGITGGFNFQNAWTSAHLAAQAIAQNHA